MFVNLQITKWQFSFNSAPWYECMEIFWSLIYTKYLWLFLCSDRLQPGSNRLTSTQSSQSCIHSGCNVERSHWMLVVQQVRVMLLIVKILCNVAMWITNKLKWARWNKRKIVINVKLSLFTPGKQVAFLSLALDGGTWTYNKHWRHYRR